MKIAFNDTHPHLNDTHPYKLRVAFHDFSKSPDERKSGQMFLGTLYYTFQDWMDAVRKTLLTLGISDFVYSFTREEKGYKHLIVNFAFSTNINLLQFSALVLPDIKGTFRRTYMTNTPEESDSLAEKIHHFCVANAIAQTTFRKSPTSIVVVTTCRHDDFAIAANEANGTFKSNSLLLKNSSELPKLLLTYSPASSPS